MNNTQPQAAQPASTTQPGAAPANAGASTEPGQVGSANTQDQTPAAKHPQLSSTPPTSKRSEAPPPPAPRDRPAKPEAPEYSEQLEKAFKHHPPANDDVVRRHEAVRAAALQFAQEITNNVPQSKERNVAIERIEEAMFWANAGIARTLSA